MKFADYKFRSYVAVACVVVVLLLGIIPSRLLNIHIGYETGTMFMIVWFMVISRCPNWLIIPIRKLFKL